jgi:hypothetical protein
MQHRDRVLLLAGALSLALVGCDRGGADGNPNAPGKPGTGNATEASAPAAPDTPPGGPSGIKGSLPHSGASGGDAPPGTTGSGTTDATGRTQVAPGAGLQGGMGSNMGAASAPSGGTAVPSGSRNRTTAGSVGNR